ncbi:amidohydrolase family protein [Massilia sp. 9I]|uniref:amidohydrolase family protein n=1 Tax=Massilia sp. 9I TaxID=2653152 RepID=UPI0012EFD40E|nr:amidohydrolase family protein [Massilia sp. 9I]VXB12685.1 Amidohydrolase [Massilia sp. 9I]
MPHSHCRAIDVHTHVVPENFPAYPGVDAAAPWPSMAPAHACHRSVMIAGSVFRTVPQQSWDAPSRSIDMDSLGIGRQVLSPMPELLSYWLAPRDGAALARHLNQDIARMVAQQPERFFGLGAVPLQDVGLAIAELDHALHTLGLAGVEIGTNVNGVPIGAPQLEPFFAAAEAWDAAIFVHPLRPCGMDRLVGPPALEQVLAFPCETGLAAASLITGGTLARHPRLRIALSHGGGSFAALAARLQHAWSIFPALRDTMGPPMESARSFYYDSLVYDRRLLENQLALFGPTQTMIGSDYPFVIRDMDPAGRIAELGLDAETTALLTHENAMRWLGPRVTDRQF